MRRAPPRAVRKQPPRNANRNGSGITPPGATAGRQARHHPHPPGSVQHPRRRSRQPAPSRAERAGEVEDEGEEPASPPSPVAINEAEVRWADVQVDEAERRVESAARQLAAARQELATRRSLHAALSEAQSLRASVVRAGQLAEQRASEAEQQRSDAALACEQAKLAVKRKHEAMAALQTVRTDERAAVEAVAELQQSLAASREASEDAASSVY